MKKIMIALAILGITFTGAEAQTKKQDIKEAQTCPLKKKAKKVVHKKRIKRTTTYAQRYQICTDEGGYNNCCVYTKRVASVTRTR